MRNHLENTKPEKFGILHAGMVMMQQGLRFPAELGLESDIYSACWRLVRAREGDSLDRRIRAIGWNLFFMAGEIRALVFGRGGSNGLHRGLKRLLATVHAREFNCMQVTEISERSFLGLSYMVLHAHACHLQKGRLLESADTRGRQQAQRDWAQD